MGIDIFKVIGIGLTGGILALFVKQYRPEMAVGISLATGIILFLWVSEGLAEIWTSMRGVMEQCGVEDQYLAAVMKVSGVAYIAQFGGELCRDSGENAIASKIELAGKIFILIVTMPIIRSFLSVCINVLQEI